LLELHLAAGVHAELNPALLFAFRLGSGAFWQYYVRGVEGANVQRDVDDPTGAYAVPLRPDHDIQQWKSAQYLPSAAERRGKIARRNSNATQRGLVTAQKI
jgi:hypothetical protein